MTPIPAYSSSGSTNLFPDCLDLSSDLCLPDWMETTLANIPAQYSTRLCSSKANSLSYRTVQPEPKMINYCYNKSLAVQ